MICTCMIEHHILAKQSHYRNVSKYDIEQHNFNVTNRTTWNHTQSPTKKDPVKAKESRECGFTSLIREVVTKPKTG